MANSDIQNQISKRLFNAIKPELSTAIAESISALKKLLKNSTINWVAWKNLHLTLVFLGDTPVSKIDDIQKLILQSASKIECFNLVFRNFGSFGKPYPKVIWIGTDECKPLRNLQNSLSKNLLENNLKFDRKDFSPHLTIGRVKYLSEIEKLDDYIQSKSGLILQQVKIESVILFESILKPDGPEYRIVSEHQLQ
jgi:RNA 2',3'-cyclic 3'-phosphodiesterase